MGEPLSNDEFAALLRQQGLEPVAPGPATPSMGSDGAATAVSDTPMSNQEFAALLEQDGPSPAMTRPRGMDMPERRELATVKGEYPGPDDVYSLGMEKRLGPRWKEYLDYVKSIPDDVRKRFASSHGVGSYDEAIVQKLQEKGIEPGESTVSWDIETRSAVTNIAREMHELKAARMEKDGLVAERAPADYRDAAIWLGNEQRMDERRYEQLATGQKVVGFLSGTAGRFAANVINFIPEVIGQGQILDDPMEAIREEDPKGYQAFQEHLDRNDVLNWSMVGTNIGLDILSMVTGAKTAGALSKMRQAPALGAGFARGVTSSGGAEERLVEAAKAFAFYEAARVAEPYIAALEEKVGGVVGRAVGAAAEGSLEAGTEAAGALAFEQNLGPEELALAAGFGLLRLGRGGAGKGGRVPRSREITRKGLKAMTESDVAAIEKIADTVAPASGDPAKPEAPRAADSRPATRKEGVGRFQRNMEGEASARRDAEILHDVVKQTGITADQLTDRFYRDVYDKATPKEKALFDKQIEWATGEKPGDVYGYDRKTDTNVLFKSHREVLKNAIDIDIGRDLRGLTDLDAPRPENPRLLGLLGGMARRIGEAGKAGEALPVKQPRLAGAEPTPAAPAEGGIDSDARVRKFREELGFAGSTGRKMDLNVPAKVKVRTAQVLGDLKTAVHALGKPEGSAIVLRARATENRIVDAYGRMLPDVETARKVMGGPGSAPGTPRGRVISDLTRLRTGKNGALRPLWLEIVEENVRAPTPMHQEIADAIQDVILARGVELERVGTKQRNNSVFREIKSLRAKAEKARQDKNYDLLERIDQRIEEIEPDLWHDFVNKPGVAPMEPTAELFDILHDGPTGERWEPVVQALADANGAKFKDVESHFNGLRDELIGEDAGIEGMKATSARTQADFERSFPNNPYAVDLPGSKRRIYLFEHDPRAYVESLAARGAKQVGFREIWGQDLKGDGGKWGEAIVALKKSGADPKPAIELGRALQGVPVEPTNWLPAGNPAERIGRGVSAVYNAAQTTGSTIPNIGEFLTFIEHGGMRDVGKVLADVRIFTKGGRAAIKAEEAQLQRDGILTEEVMNLHWDPSRPVDSAKRITTELLSHGFGVRGINQIQETKLGRIVQRWTDRMASRDPAKGPRGDDVTRLRTLGFDYEASKRIARGDGTQAEYREARQRTVSRGIGSNLAASEASRLEQSKWHRLLTRFDRIAQAYTRRTIRQVGASFETAFRAGRDKSLTKSQRAKVAGGAMAQLGKVAVGRTLSGSAQAFLAAALFQGPTGFESMLEKFYDSPGWFLVESAASATFFGKWGAIARGMDGELTTANAIWFADLITDTTAAVTGSGRYRDTEGADAVLKLLQRRIPGVKLVDTALAAIGITSMRRKDMDATRAAYWRWREDRGTKPDFSKFRDPKDPELSRALSIMRRAVRNGTPPEEYDERIKALFAGTGRKKSKAISNVKRAMTLRDHDKAELADLKDFIGDRAYKMLEIQDESYKALIRAIRSSR